MKLTKTIAFFLCLWYIAPLHAGDLTLDADKRVEYHQKSEKIVAIGNAIAKKNGSSIKGDTLIGYRDSKSKDNFSKIEAFGNVVVKTPKTTLTARGSFKYFADSLKIIATDNVSTTDAKGTKVSADLVTAYLTKDKSGTLEIDRIHFEKNIKIDSQGTVVTADKGVYKAAAGKITLTENVTISQNGNVLRGTKAETDLNSGISKLLSDEPSGRISGVFKEKSKKD